MPARLAAWSSPFPRLALFPKVISWAQAKRRRQAAARNFQVAQVPTWVKGTLGVIVSATHAGHVSLVDATRLVTRIGDRPDIWIHERLCQKVIATLRDIG